MINPINTQAATTENDWIADYLKDYEPLQSLLEEYPDAELVQNKTTYILTETVKDEEGNILKTNRKEFLSLSSMENYEKAAKSLDLVTPNTVSPGGTTYRDYSQIRMGLSLYQYSSNSFFVACTYEWLNGFNYDLFFDYKAVIGLAVGTGLSMVGTSYGGRVTMRTINNQIIEKTTVNGTLTVKPTGTNGIGYSIKQSA